MQLCNGLRLKNVTATLGTLPPWKKKPHIATSSYFHAEDFSDGENYIRPNGNKSDNSSDWVPVPPTAIFLPMLVRLIFWEDHLELMPLPVPQLRMKAMMIMMLRCWMLMVELLPPLKPPLPAPPPLRRK